MRFLLALFVTAVSVVAVDADIRGRRAGGNRITPFRNSRIFNGYNTRYPGYESEYYTPYSATNSNTLTISPSSSARILQPAPAIGSSIEGDSIPTWQPQSFPQSNTIAPTVQPSNELRSIGNETTQSTPKTIKSIRKNIPANYQLKSQGNSYWDDLNHD